MKIYKKAILPAGFSANGIACGIKKSGKPDLALFYSGIPAKAACKFTVNKIPAAPVVLSKKLLGVNKRFQAIIANSGNANAFTGRVGLKDAEEIAARAAASLNICKSSVLSASTGIIGKRMPLAKIINGISGLVSGLSSKGIDKAKKAIMTTDIFAKEISVKFNIGNKEATICGVAKGSGMVAPTMATMLTFIFTDANIAQGALNKALKLAVDDSFNCITVDGCMSTNDSVMLLANGASGNALIEEGRYFKLFLAALKKVCLKLAEDIVRDGEGATKFIRIEVDKAKNVHQARKAALYIANSNLVKTAVYGENPNFGRVVSAVGASGIDADEKGLKIKLGSLKKKDITIHVSLNKGNGRAVVFTSDLSPEYIKINAAYN